MSATKAPAAADLEFLRSEKDRLEREISEYQAMIRRLQTSRARLGESNPALQETLAALRKTTDAQVAKTHGLQEKHKQLVATKASLEKQAVQETDQQVRRRETLEDSLLKVKSVFEEENEKRGQLENVKLGLEFELRRMRKLLVDEQQRRRQTEQSFRRDLETLKALVK